MLKNIQSARERWGGVSEIVDRWLLERQGMLVLFLSLTDKNADHEPGEKEANLRKFCQIVVDYVSAGHFEVYEQLAQEARDLDDQQSLHEASEKYRTVDGTTEEILDFNDKYQETDDLSSLESDLSRLGECLETRFEAEDYMIDVLHVRNKDKVS